MIRKSVQRFSEKIMRKQKLPGAGLNPRPAMQAGSVFEMNSEPWSHQVEPRIEPEAAADNGRLVDRVIRSVVSADPYDLLTAALLAALALAALLTFRDYAISNDEGVQHRYGELIIEYYRSGFVARDLFIVPESLPLWRPVRHCRRGACQDRSRSHPFELRHILCAMTGIGGIAAAAATARLIAGPRAGLIAAVALAVCGAWYGAMFNHTKDIPFAAAMMGATYFLVRIARHLPSPRRVDVLAFSLMAGLALGVRSLGLLLFVYLGLAIVIYLPWRAGGGTALRFAGLSLLRTLPAVAAAYLIMILAWPWALCRRSTRSAACSPSPNFTMPSAPLLPARSTKWAMCRGSMFRPIWRSGCR